MENKEKLIQENQILTGKQLYQRPLLVKFGDLRSVVLGMSPGTGESGSSETRWESADASSGDEKSINKGILSGSDPYAPSDPGQP